MSNPSASEAKELLIKQAEKSSAAVGYALRELANHLNFDAFGRIPQDAQAIALHTAALLQDHGDATVIKR